jgi:serine/threonine-protein kinase
MDFIRGRTLEQLIRERGVFSAREAMLIASDLCRALSAVHKAGLLHRDLKAQNVMREDGGRIVLMDFGTGRELVPAGPEPVRDFAGTPLYLAPEILRGKPATARSDVYSLGVLLFRLVTGEYPVAGRSLRDVTAAHERGAHVAVTDLRPDLPDAFVQVLNRALASDPQARFETAGAMEQALSRVLGQETPGTDPGVLTPAERTPTPAVVPAAAPPGRRVWPWGLAAAALLVLLATGGLLVATGVLQPSRWFGNGKLRIAVLPFENQTGDTTADLLCDGVADALVANLSQIRALEVVATTTTRLYKGTKLSTQAIGAELDAEYLVEGKLYRQQDVLRLFVNVIRVANQKIEVSRQLDRDQMLGVLAYQGDVARVIADTIKVTVTEAEGTRLAARPVVNQAAMDLYLKGIDRLVAPYKPDVEEAVRLLEAAIRTDERLVPAHIHLADAYIRLANVSTSIPRDESIRRARVSAQQALSLSPDQAGAYVALARVRQYFDWDWQGAEEAFKRALDVNPSSADAAGYYAMFLAAFERFDEALAQSDRARVLDPGPVVRTTSYAAILNYARKPDDALAEIRSALSRDPSSVTGHYTLGLMLATKGDYDAAIAAIEKSVEGYREVGRLADLARVHALAGHRAEAERILAEMSAASAAGARFSPDKPAFVYAALGDADRAFAFLRQAVQEKSSGLAWLRVDPRWDPIRLDSRFAPIVAEMRLNR